MYSSVEIFFNSGTKSGARPGLEIGVKYRIGHRLELKYFLFAQLLHDAYQAAQLPQKSED